MLTRPGLAHFAGGVAAVLVSLGVQRSATAIPYIPPFPAVINQPARIPPTGVLAVGTYDQQLGTLLTTGTLASVSNAASEAITGTSSQFSVPLDASAMQTVSVWTPDAPFAAGDYMTSGQDTFAGMGSSFFAVVESSADPTALTLELSSVALTAVQVPAAELPCGTTFSMSAQMIPVNIVTHYRSVPTLGFELSTDAPDEVVSQFLFRAYEPGVPTQPFVPLAFADGIRAGAVPFAGPEDNYCVAAEAVSLINQAVQSLDPVCVPDDGHDWEALTPATGEQIDAQLLGCPEPPEEYLPRYCALARDSNVLNANCDVFTDEELDAAGPIVVDDDVRAPGPNLDDPAQVGEPDTSADDDDDSVDTSAKGAPAGSASGCSVGAGTGRGSSWWRLLALGAMLVRRLRRRTPRPATLQCLVLQQTPGQREVVDPCQRPVASNRHRGGLLASRRAGRWNPEISLAGLSTRRSHRPAVL